MNMQNPFPIQQIGRNEELTYFSERLILVQSRTDNDYVFGVRDLAIGSGGGFELTIRLRRINSRKNAIGCGRGSRGRIRTYDQSVNSRPLYH
jgi:hypothetical protein